MTQREFDRKFPNGLNKIIVLFEKSLHQIMTTDEIDKIIKYAPLRERRYLKKFKVAYRNVFEDWDCPIWGILPMIKSTRLLQNIITVMVINYNKVLDDEDFYHGEGEEVE